MMDLCQTAVVVILHLTITIKYTVSHAYYLVLGGAVQIA